MMISDNKPGWAEISDDKRKWQGEKRPPGCDRSFAAAAFMAAPSCLPDAARQRYSVFTSTSRMFISPRYGSRPALKMIFCPIGLVTKLANAHGSALWGSATTA